MPTNFPQYPGAPNPLLLNDLLPDGKHGLQLKDSFTPDPEHLWSYGSHPHATAAEMEQFKAMLVRNRGSFAYSMNDLPGYNGDPVDVEMVDDLPIVSPPRQYSYLEREIRDEKCNELKAAGMIEPADPHNPYASCPTMPAKKDEHGNWVERRFCVDYRMVNAKQKTLDRKSVV